MNFYTNFVILFMSAPPLVIRFNWCSFDTYYTNCIIFVRELYYEKQDMSCPALLGIFSMTKAYLTLPYLNPNLTLLLVYGNPVILVLFGNIALIKLMFFFKLIAVAVAAANVLSCWILPFIIQWRPLNVITDNVIIRLMLSNCQVPIICFL
jgi:hypothetical protein